MKIVLTGKVCEGIRGLFAFLDGIVQTEFRT